MTASLLASTLVVGVLAALAFAGGGGAGESRSASASANDFTIVLERRIGPYDYRDRAAGPSASARALRAFGRPSSRYLDGNLCRLRWSRLGLELAFFGSRCWQRQEPRNVLCSATMTRPPWRTREGLKVGDSEARIRRLYPRARFEQLSASGRREWLLVTRRHPDFGLLPMLTAETFEGDEVIAIGLSRSWICV